MITLIRYSPPSKLDQAPCGTQCKVKSALLGEYEIYQQMNSDEESPCWRLIDTVKK